MFDNIETSQSGIQVAINAGNPADFKTIYDNCMQMLFKISYRIVNDEEAAEDLVHDSLIKANEKCLVVHCAQAGYSAVQQLLSRRLHAESVGVQMQGASGGIHHRASPQRDRIALRNDIASGRRL